jgi:hypothetical protein
VFWANRINKVAGVALLALPILSVVGFVGAGPIAEIDPFARGDIEGLLRAIHENRGLFVLSLIPFVVTDVVALPVVAALFCVAFRDRSPLLALMAAFCVLIGALAFVVHELGAMTLPFLAADFFVEGGAPGVLVGDPTILQTARFVSMFQGLAALCGQTAMGLGIGSVGVLIAWAPEGIWNPPRWLGAVAMSAGVGMISTWLFLLNHTAGGIATLIAETATVLMAVILGVWFLRQPAQSANN